MKRLSIHLVIRLVKHVYVHRLDTFFYESDEACVFRFRCTFGIGGFLVFFSARI